MARSQRNTKSKSPKNAERLSRRKRVELGWQNLQKSMNAERRALPLSRFAWPARFRTVIAERGWAKLGELASHDYAELLQRNLGITSIERILSVIEHELEEGPRRLGLEKQRNKKATRTLVDLWHAMLEPLPEQQRDIIERRAGFDGDRETLRGIGKAFKFSYERARQVEAMGVERLKGDPLYGVLVGALQSALKGGVVDVASLSRAAFWKGATDRTDWLRFLVQDLTGLGSVASFADRHWLSPDVTAEVNAAERAARAALAEAKQPVSDTHRLRIVRKAAASIDAAWAPILAAHLA